MLCQHGCSRDKGKDRKVHDKLAVRRLSVGRLSSKGNVVKKERRSRKKKGGRGGEIYIAGERELNCLS